MSLDKFNATPSPLQVVEKVNDVIDALGASSFDGYWEAGESVEVGDIRYVEGRDNVGYILECVQAGTTGTTQPSFSSSDVEAGGGASVMEGATASGDGKEGSVPAPTKGQQQTFLRGDGTWSNSITELAVSTTLTIPGGKIWIA